MKKNLHKFASTPKVCILW